MKVRLVGHYVNPHTYDLIVINIVIDTTSAEAAKKWAKQTFYKAQINIAEEVKDDS